MLLDKPGGGCDTGGACRGTATTQGFDSPPRHQRQPLESEVNRGAIMSDHTASIESTYSVAEQHAFHVAAIPVYWVAYCTCGWIADAVIGSASGSREWLDAMRDQWLEHIKMAERSRPARRTVAHEAVIVVDPARLSGEPTIGNSRLPAGLVARTYWLDGRDEVRACWPELTDLDILVCCWYVVRYGMYTFGTSKDHRQWGDWLTTAETMLARQTVKDCPWPPKQA